jgi:HtrA serine peptidase 2
MKSCLLLLGGFAIGKGYSSENQQQLVYEGEEKNSAYFPTTATATFSSLLRPLQASAQASFTSSILPETPSKRSGGTSTPLAGCLSPYFISDAAAKAAPAVVNILVQQEGIMPGVGSSGSGFIVSPNGSVLTNAHVVADALTPPGMHNKNNGGGFRGGWGRHHSQQQQHHFPVKSSNTSNGSKDASKSIAVTLQDGRTFEAEVVNYDTVSDLAVLKMKDVNEPLPVAKLGVSSGLRVGEWVIALGSPLHLQNSVSAGIISCVDRKAAELGLTGARAEYIQTDASINRGSSGGPLVNLAGEVVGVSCMKALAADGVSFAIPIDTVREVVRQLEIHGRVIRPYIGVKLLQLNPYTVLQLRKKDPNFPYVSSGVLVPAVAAGSPADKAGLKSGDIIVRYGGSTKDVTTSMFIKQLEQHIGEEMSLDVVRPDGKGGSAAVSLKIVAEEAAGQGVGAVLGQDNGITR